MVSGQHRLKHQRSAHLKMSSFVLCWWRSSWCLVLLVSLNVVVEAFVASNPWPTGTFGTTTRFEMVRNIDLPEALVFYGRKVVLEDDDITPRYGLQELLQECREVETAAILMDDATNIDESLPAALSACFTVYPISKQESLSSNPRHLWEAVHSITVQPRGFGGSSGFGRKQADQFTRNPLPRHTVVFCDSTEICRAARYCGMRVLCFSDNDLADAIVDGYDGLYLDDVATPGSYWLNPPHPSDDEGNRVDPEEIMEWYESRPTTKPEDEGKMSGTDDIIQEEGLPPPLSDDELDRILADLDPL